MRPKFGPQGLETPDPQLNLLGGSFLRSEAYRAREAHFFISDPEDIVDVQVAEYFKAKPDAYSRTRLTRIRPGVYSMFGKEIVVEWVESSGSVFDKMMASGNKNGMLMVSDGPMSQPFADYMEYLAVKEEARQQYNGSVFKAQNALQTIPQEDRMTFADTGYNYSRIDAMKVAQEQAKVRETAANMMTNQAGASAEHIMDRMHSLYEKRMSNAKLGNGWRQEQPTQVRGPAMRAPAHGGAPLMSCATNLSTHSGLSTQSPIPGGTIKMRPVKRTGVSPCQRQIR